MPELSYLVDNAWHRGGARLDAVGAVLDPSTYALLERIGISDGWHRLGLGADGGSRPRISTRAISRRERQRQ